MRRILKTLGTFAIGTSSLAAADLPKADDPAALVQKLGDPQFAVREAATKNLLKLGGSAIPAIQSAIDTTADPGLRERAEVLLPRLQLRAESDRVLTAKLVKLDYKDMPLSTVVEDLKKQTGIPLMLDPTKVPLPMRTITLTGGEVSAWQAIELLCAAAGVKEDHRAELPLPSNVTNTSSGRYYSRGFSYSNDFSQPAYYSPSTAPIILVDGKLDKLPGNRQQSIRVLAVPGNFDGNRVIRGTGTVLMNLDVAPLPSLNWTGSSHVRVTKAEDEDGRPLFADQKPHARQPQNQYEDWGGGLAWGGGQVWIDDVVYPINATTRGSNPRLAPVRLRTDDRAIKLLKRFEGVIIGDVNQANQPIITIDDMVKSVGRSFDGSNNIKLSITDYKIVKDGVTVKLHVEMPQQWVAQQADVRRKMNLDDLNIGNVQNKLKFTDADGKPVAAPSQRSANYSGTQWMQTYDAELHFPKSDKAGPPLKVTLTGTKVTTIEIPFSLENVRLP